MAATIHKVPKTLLVDISLLSSNNSQLITKKSQYYTLFKYNYFNKMKISYNGSSSRSPIMCLPSVVNTGFLDNTEEIPRPITNTSFGRSLWAEDSFSAEDDHKQLEQAPENYAEEIELLKEKVRNMVIDTKNYAPSDKMVLIDTLERLDIAYHFKQEIEDQIQQIFMHNYEDPDDGDQNDLFTTALYFRLFRQHGYNVSCSVFEKFKDEDNTFKKTLSHDIEGLLSLYEASFLRFHEENVLKEARVFTTHHLNETKLHLEDSSHLMEKVKRALKQPLHWALPKVEARHYFPIYEEQESKDDTLIRLAKLDFYVMQNEYKREMHEVQKWWYSFDLISKLPYARDCVVLCYFWAAGLNYEAEYSRSRIDAAKTLVMGTFFNDTYDSYGTLKELQVFTDIVQRWDPKDIDKLPNYLKIVYNVLLTAFDEFEHETSEQGRSYTVAYVKETLSQMAAAYYKKANWFNAKETPTFQDHVDYMGITSGIHQLLSAFYVHTKYASKDTFDWLMNKPTSVEQAALYCRYLNDLSTYEREQEVGQYPVAVDTYMEEKGVSVQETKEKFAEFAEDCWMTINMEWIKTSNSVQKELLKPVINFCRIVFATYGYGLDYFSYPEEGLYDSINSLLVDPLVV